MADAIAQQGLDDMHAALKRLRELLAELLSKKWEKDPSLQTLQKPENMDALADSMVQKAKTRYVKKRADQEFESKAFEEWALKRDKDNPGDLSAATLNPTFANTMSRPKRVSEDLAAFEESNKRDVLAKEPVIDINPAAVQDVAPAPVASTQVDTSAADAMFAPLLAKEPVRMDGTPIVDVSDERAEAMFAPLLANEPVRMDGAPIVDAADERAEAVLAPVRGNPPIVNNADEADDAGGAGGEDIYIPLPPEPAAKTGAPKTDTDAEAEKADTKDEAELPEMASPGIAPIEPDDQPQRMDWRGIANIFPAYEGSPESLRGNGNALRHEVFNGSNSKFYEFNAPMTRFLCTTIGGFENAPQFQKAMAALAAENDMSVEELLALDTLDENGEPNNRLLNVEQTFGQFGVASPRTGEVQKKTLTQARSELFNQTSGLFYDPADPNFPLPIVAVGFAKKEYWNPFKHAFRDRRNAREAMEQGNSQQLAYGANMVYQDKGNNFYADTGNGVRAYLAPGQAFGIEHASNIARTYLSARQKNIRPGDPLQRINYVIDTGIKGRKYLLNPGEHTKRRDMQILAALHHGMNLGMVPNLSVKGKFKHTPIGELSLANLDASAIADARARGWDVNKLIAFHNENRPGAAVSAPGVSGEPLPSAAPETQAAPIIPTPTPTPVPTPTPARPKLEDLAAQHAGDLFQKLTNKDIAAYLNNAADTQASLMVLDNSLRDAFPDTAERNGALIEFIENPKRTASYIDQINAEIGDKRKIVDAKNGLGPEHEAVPGILDILERHCARDLKAQGRPDEDMDGFRDVKEATILAQTAARIEEIARHPAKLTPYDAVKTSDLDSQDVKDAAHMFNILKQAQAGGSALSSDAIIMAKRFAGEKSAIAAEMLDRAHKSEGADFVRAVMNATDADDVLTRNAARTGENAPVVSRSPLAPQSRANGQDTQRPTVPRNSNGRPVMH